MTDEPLRGQPASQDAAPTAASARPAGTRLGFSNYLGLALALVAMIVLFSLLSAHFLTYDTFSTIANQIPDLVVMAVGMTLVLIIAGIDLSVGSVLALGASVVSVTSPRWGWGALPTALAGLVAAAACGTPTGAVTVGWRIPSFIVSLGVLEAARGLAYQMTNSRTAYIGDAFDFLSSPVAFGTFARIPDRGRGHGDRATGAHAHRVRPLSDRHRHERRSGAACGRRSAAV